MKLNQDDIKKRFLEDTADHTLAVKRDDGLYRHLTFSDNGSSVYRFDLVTWPGHLSISGDCGTYVFARDPDMFKFFKGDFDGKFPINAHYWGQKLEAVCTNGGFMEYSPDLFKAQVKECYDQYIKDVDWDPEHEISQMLWNNLEDEVLLYASDSEERAMDAALSFTSDHDDFGVFDMESIWEHDFKDYTYHYIWVLFAISWGIREYNARAA